MTADPAPEPRQRRPLTQILAAFEAGAATPAEVSRRTGLSSQVVSAGVEHLVRTGRLVAEPLSLACPAQGCGGCPTVAADGERCSASPLVAFRLVRD